MAAEFQQSRNMFIVSNF